MNRLYYSVDTKSTPNRRKVWPAFEKGQLWKAKDAYIQIMDLGKRLIDYKMMRELGQARRTQTTSLETLQTYLKTNGGQLMKNAAP